MADGDKELDVVVGDSEPGDKGKTDEKSVDEQLAEMRAELDRERAARTDAERRANEAGGEVAKSAEQVRQSHLTTMSTAVEVLTQKRMALRREKIAAKTDGDFEREAELDDALMETIQQINEISKGKTLLEATPAQQPRRIVRSGDPVVEGVAASLTPKSADWVRAHPEYARDTKLLNRMKAAHFEVVAELGEEIANNETPEYFAAVEQKLGLSGRTSARNGDAAGEGGANVTVTSDAAAPVQARQQRDVQPSPAPGQSGGTRTRTVRLTPEEQEAAKINHMSHEEYAKFMLAEKAKGTIGKLTH